MRTHRQTNLNQYASRASAYRDSAVHSAGPDLERACGLIADWRSPSPSALDVGCGAGHLSYALAPSLTHVVALDPSAEMLATVTEGAAARGLMHIETRQGSAEALPFASASFDLVCTRYSAHHWTDLELALRELRRVLKPGGRLLVIDALGEENALVDTHLQTLELLRDRSHVRNRSRTQWAHLLVATHFSELLYESWPIRMEFSAWVARMDTPPSRIEALREVQNHAPSEVQDALAIEPDGSFTLRTGLLWAGTADPALPMMPTSEGVPCSH